MRTGIALVSLALVGLAPPAAAQGPCGSEVELRSLDAGVVGPRLRTPDGAPVIGGPFSLRVEDALPNTQGAMVFSPVESPFFEPTYGATFWFGSPFSTIFFMTDAEGRSGSLSVVGAVDPFFCGEPAVFQAGVFDPMATGGVAVTNAISLRVGAVTEPLFSPHPLPTDGTEMPGDLALGDMDEDGVLDLVSVTNKTASVRPGLVGGGFGRAGKTVLTASGIFGLELADFDGDGHQDLLREAAGGLAIAFGDGAGSFVAESVYLRGGDVLGTALGDLDEDGALDLATVTDESEIAVMLGSGAGVFSLPVSYTTGSFSFSLSGVKGADLALADLDQDGHQDAVTTQVVLLAFISQFPETHAAALPGAGDGTLGAPLEIDLPTSGTFPPEEGGRCSLALADLDGDTVLDLAVSNEDNKSVAVVLGNGDLTFAPYTRHVFATVPHQVVAANVDGDSDQDLLVRHHLSEDLSVLTGNGDGTFEVGTRVGVFPRSTVSSGLVVTDVDLDGNADALVTGRTEIVTVLGRGDATFRAPVRHLSASGFLERADFDEDGDLDIVTFTDSGFAILAYLGEDGVFGPPVASATTTFWRRALSADVDGDGHLDLVLATPNLARVAVALGNGDGTFAPESDVLTAASNFVGFALADFDGDTVLDLVVARNAAAEVLVALGNGDGTFGAAVAWATTSNPSLLHAGDLDGDSVADLIYWRTSAQSVEARLGNGDGTFAAAAVVGTAVSVSAATLTVGDLGGDGDLDVIVSRSSPRELHVLENDGTGQLTDTHVVASDERILDLELADMDGDGDVDVVGLGGTGRAAVFPWTDAGQLGSPEHVRVGDTPEVLAVGDLDGDGIVDLAVLEVHGSFPDEVGVVTIAFSEVGE